MEANFTLGVPQRVSVSLVSRRTAFSLDSQHAVGVAGLGVTSLDELGELLDPGGSFVDRVQIRAPEEGEVG
jgi:hypothetical protein